MKAYLYALGPKRLHRVVRFSLEHNDPSNGLQEQSYPSKARDHCNVRRLVRVLWFQNAETFKDINDTEDKDRIANSMVVDIPIESVLVVIFRPQQHRKHLNIDTKDKSSLIGDTNRYEFCSKKR